VKREPAHTAPEKLRPVTPRTHPDVCDICEEKPVVLLHLANGVQLCPRCRRERDRRAPVKSAPRKPAAPDDDLGLFSEEVV
jgi:hypothetical protein